MVLVMVLVKGMVLAPLFCAMASTSKPDTSRPDSLTTDLKGGRGRFLGLGDVGFSRVYCKKD